MNKITLKAEKRQKNEKKPGGIPAVFYGPKVENQSLFVDLNEFKKAWREAGESTVIMLNFPPQPTPGVGGPPTPGVGCPVLIYNVQTHPVTDEPIHVDFYAVDMSKKTTAVVPLEFTGEAPAIKLGGTLVKVVHEVEVEALPADLPHNLEVDVSGLKTFEDKILIKDIKKPQPVEILAEPEETVAFVEEVKEESFDEDQDKEERKIEDIEVTGKKPEEEKTGEETINEQKNEKKQETSGRQPNK